MTRRLDLAAEHGYTMMAVMMVMLATTMLAGAAFATVGGDIPFARAAQDRKQAYAAAEAGLEYYLYQLARDNDYWTRCDDVPDIGPGQPAPIVQDGDPRVWRAVSGADARFSLELVPANGAATCDSTDAEGTMLDAASGTFRIRSTGESRGIRRTIVATFRRSSFLDYLYFTDFETSDPLTYTTQDDRDDAVEDCVKYRAEREDWCRDITFPDFDRINGPLHTNDDLLTCGNPQFGRDKKDAIEIHGPADGGYTQSGGNGCGGAPVFNGTKRWRADNLGVPTSNAKLKTVAETSGHTYYGQTNIELHANGTMDVTSYDPDDGDPVTQTGIAPPDNGVIYVQRNPDLGCSGIRGPLEQRYTDPNGCAILTLSGTYAKSMTLGSDADIVIDGDIEKANDNVVLGLVALNFVRVKHQVRDCPSTGCHIMDDVKVEAAILTLAHSFIVDNYNAGSRRGTLRVDGAIAQRFRGPVGTFNTSTGTGSTGYTKDYWYDNRLRYRSPPYFLDPVAAAWRIIRANEQVPAPAND